MISITHDVKGEFETFVVVCGKPFTESYDALQEWFQFLLTGRDVNLCVQRLGFLPKLFFLFKEQVIVPVQGGAIYDISLK